MVLATSNTNLSEADLFYFGNAVGDTGAGNLLNVVLVDEIDEAAVQENLYGESDLTTIDNGYDFNRDGLVNENDQRIVRNNRQDSQTGLRLNIVSDRPATGDLTGDGFVDFDDLTVLLDHWNQHVSAAQGNLVDPANTRANFDDLAVLLIAWTGPAPGASPQRAAAEITAAGVASVPGRDAAGTESRIATNAHFERLGRRDRGTIRRVGRAEALPSWQHAPLRRLQAATVDRAMGERTKGAETHFFRRRSPRLLSP